MAHLEVLVAEYLDWKGMLVKRNVKVGHRGSKGGWDGELDVVGYDPNEKYIVHYELSLDANSWAEREAKYIKKMESGKKYILTELFSWLPPDTRLEQFAVFPIIGSRTSLAGANLVAVDDLVQRIASEVRNHGLAARKAVPELYPLLRIVQLVVAGYSRAPGAA